jgi:hypothetical protein
MLDNITPGSAKKRVHRNRFKVTGSAFTLAYDISPTEPVTWSRLGTRSYCKQNLARPDLRLTSHDSLKFSGQSLTRLETRLS